MKTVRPWDHGAAECGEAVELFIEQPTECHADGDGRRLFVYRRNHAVRVPGNNVAMLSKDVPSIMRGAMFLSLRPERQSSARLDIVRECYHSWQFRIALVEV
jgi:hypothetical protein